MPERTLFEYWPAGVVAIPNRPRLFHVVPAGIPFHVEHLFGFWRASQSDTVFMRIQQAQVTAYTLIVGTTAESYETDDYVWYCQVCGRELHRVHFNTRRFGTPAFWSGATERAREFNAGAQLRTCQGCGAIHPVAYGFDEAEDQPAEATARQEW